MYNIQGVISCFDTYQGFRDSEDPCIKNLLPQFTQSDSGTFFNDYHPLLSPSNLKSIAPNFEAYKIAEYDNLTAYAIGDRVKVTTGDIVRFYDSLTAANTGNDPSSNPSDWEEKDLLGQWLKEKADHATNKMIQKLATIKSLNRQTKTILDRLHLFKGAGRQSDLITKSGRAVGFEITLQPNTSLSLTLDQIGLQISTAETINIYTLHTSQIAPIETQSASVTSAGSFQWFNANQILPFVSDTLDAGGKFYVFYLEDDLTGQAINKKHDFEKPCGGCNGWTKAQYREYSKWVDIRPFSVANVDLNATPENLFDINDVRYSSNTNYGLNLNISVKCDWTNFICQNRDIFENLRGTQFAADMLNEMVSSDRDNNRRDNAVAALLGGPEVDGLKDELEKLYKGVEFGTTDLNSPCMPCDNKPYLKTSGA